MKDEKESIACLLNHNEEIQSPMLSQRSSPTISMAERLKKRRKRDEIQDYHINCDFILGFLVEFECLKSTAKNVLTENRRYMTPQLFEEIVLLKVNELF